jgi:cyclophilin family peptidyl-prolyl cis-trans isomerase
LPSKRRQAQREARATRQAALLAQRQAAKRRRVAVAVGLVIAVVAGLLLALSGDGAKGKKQEVAAGSSTTAAPTTVAAATGCPPSEGVSVPQRQFSAPPEMCIDPAKAYTAEVRTNKGVMTIALDAKSAPKTVNNFVFLARNHFYDGVVFHRIIPGFVVQGGDPQGTGMGGPGYKFADELPRPGAYKIGSLAMANSGPNTNGSQFFIVTGDPGTGLPPNYSLFGQVTGGLEVAKAIEAVGTPEGKPRETVTIESVTITER